MENEILLNRYLYQLKNNALDSNIQIKLSACLIKGKKMICKPCSNLDRSWYRGINYGSLHAEAHAIMVHYGKNLLYDKMKKRWCLLWRKRKVYKEI
jgi:hypothetical protein